MTNWVQIYAAAWLGLLSSSILMANWVSKKSRSRFADFVEQIDVQNAEMGLNRSVPAKELALDYLLPFRNKAIKQYVDRNDFSETVYIETLQEKVRWPVYLVVYLVVFGLTLFYGFAGPLVYYFSGTAYLAEYLVGFLVLVLFSLMSHILL